jgi:aspartyl-tRNA(Asn)/glutamyl-tRNA(Gln) amidotransferase subunit B
LLEKGGSPKKIIESKGMTQISDPVELGKIVDEIIAAHPKELEKFRSGKGNMKGFLCRSNYEANGGTY